ncbi:MAG: zinc metallopeptidase [Mycoplasmatales bacterium]|nr:zinc metallopeptidase [Mycoplasmatales bacterium]
MNKINDLPKTSKDETIVAWTTFAFLILALIIFILLITTWIYYSWIRKNNSKGYTGKEITEEISKKANINMEIKNSWFYVKYWNYNKRKNMYRLRPWTYSRNSIWTIMEATQQVYVTTIKLKKKKEIWLVFWIPVILRVTGYIFAVIFLFIGIKDFKELEKENSNWLDNIKWLWIGIAMLTIFSFHTIADILRIIVIRKNVLSILKEMKFTNEEISSINKIYICRLIYSITAFFLEINKLIIKIILKIWDFIK